MSFNAETKTENNFSDYKELNSKAATIESLLSVWVGKYDVLYADVSAAKQAELAAKKTAFVNQLKTTLGL